MKKFFTYDVILSHDRYESQYDTNIKETELFTQYFGLHVFLPYKREINQNTTKLVPSDFDSHEYNIKSTLLNSLNLKDRNLGIENYIANPDFFACVRKNTSANKIGELVSVLTPRHFGAVFSPGEKTCQYNKFYKKTIQEIDINLLPDINYYHYVLFEEYTKPDIVIPEKQALHHDAWVLIDRDLVMKSKTFYDLFYSWRIGDVENFVKSFRENNNPTENIKYIKDIQNPLYFIDTIISREWRIKLNI